MLKKTLILAVIAISIFPIQTAEAAKCPVKTKLPYKAKGDAAVYYVTPQCTKRAFPNPTTFFAYFSSWKEVKVTTKAILKKIPNDTAGSMKIYKPEKNIPKAVVNPPLPNINPITTPVTTSTTPQPQKTETVAPPPAAPTKVEVPPAPIVTQPITVNPTPTPPTPTLTGVVAEYLTCPSESDRAVFDNDFSIVWIKDWDAYPFSCELKTTQPTRLPLYNTLRLLKNIHFAKPLPFTNGVSLYTFLTQKKVTLIPLHSCAAYSSGWNYQINLGGIFAHTHPITSNSALCEPKLSNDLETLDGFVRNPLYKAGTLVHEAHHAIAGSIHTDANAVNDVDINEMGAWAAQFYFYAWVNVYSTNVDATTKLLAKNAAIDILTLRFRDNKCPKDVALKNIVNSLKPQTCN